MNRRTLCCTLAAAALLTGWNTGAFAGDAIDARAHFAHAVYSGSPDWVHDRQPQPLLRAVVVLRIRLHGEALRAEVMRYNDEQPEMLARALETVKRVRASDLPPEVRQRLTREGVIETWLFDRDGSFQVRTLAKPQRSA